MKLTNPNRQKLSIRRAVLWANVYHTALDSTKGSVTNGQMSHHVFAQENADRALKAFDERFPMDVVIEAAGEAMPKK